MAYRLETEVSKNGKTDSIGSFDLLNPGNSLPDKFLFEAVKTELIPEHSKPQIISNIASEIFGIPEKVLDEKRASDFLAQANEYFNDKDAPALLKDAFETSLTAQVLEEIKVQSAKHRWGYEAAQQAMEAYSNFMSFEKAYGPEKAKELVTKISQKTVRAREAVFKLDKAASVAENENRGVVISLMPQGKEVQDVIIQEATSEVADEFKGRRVISGYYRDHILTMNVSAPEEDPDENLMTFSEAITELCRVEGSPTGPGTNICVKQKINKSGQISVMHGVANVGDHILPASGFADGMRLDAIREAGLTYPQAERSDKYPLLQVENTKGIVVISLGDGATPKLVAALPHQVLNRTPAVNVIFNNEIAIGATSDELNAQKQLHKLGRSVDTPGVSVGKTDFDKLYFAARFAATRAYMDAGPSIIEAKVTRLYAHSNAHGDALTSQYKNTVQKILEEYMERVGPDGKNYELVSQFKDNGPLFGKNGENGLHKTTKDDNQIQLKNRLSSFLKNDLLDEELKGRIRLIADDIIDPTQSALDYWSDNGYITKDQVCAWKEEAKTDFGTVFDKIFAKENGDPDGPFILKRPDPKDAMKNIRLPIAEGIVLPLPQVLLRNKSAAQNEAFKSARRLNDRVLFRGTDVIKGETTGDKFIVENGVKKRIKFPKFEGGYFHTEDGLFEEFGMIPGSIANTQISEHDVAMYLSGMATTPTDEKSLARSWRVVYDPQYGDYGIQADKAFYIQGNILQNTDGKQTRTFGMVLNSSASAGGGGFHSHSVEQYALALPPSVDVFYGSYPPSIYKNLLGNILYNNNMWVGLMDKSDIFKDLNIDWSEQDMTFRPGRARLAKAGKGLQFVTFGPMANIIMDTIRSLPQDLTRNIGVLDLEYLRPFPYEDLRDFLDKGEGPIVVAQQSPIGRRMSADYSPIHKTLYKTYNNDGNPELSQGVAGQIIELMVTDPDLIDIAYEREIYPVGAKPTAAPLCDKNLMDVTIPDKNDIRELILAAA